jgi:hypothetical protein
VPLPVVVLGLALADLPWRTSPLRYAAATAGVSGLALAASATGAATEPAAEVAVVAVPVLAAFALLLLAGWRRGRPLVLAAVTVLAVQFGHRSRTPGLPAGGSPGAPSGTRCTGRPCSAPSTPRRSPTPRAGALRR